MHHRLAPFAIAGALLVAGACGTTGQEQAGSTSGGGGREITGAGGGERGRTSSTGLPMHGDGGSGGAGGQVGHGAPYPVILAHGFFGFEDFAGQDFITYFYQVKDKLAAQGVTVYTPAVDPFNDSDTRGAELLTHVQEVIAETGAAKVNIIGHSQGGLDARVVANLRPDLVASIVTIGTPHQGTPVADVVLDLVSDPNAQDAIDELVQIIGAPLWDQAGNQSSVFKPLKLFSTPGIAAFNAAHPNEPNVYYASIAGRTALQASDNGDCVATTPQPFLTQWDDSLDSTDAGLVVTELICANGFDNDTNDGLVPAKSAQWGDFWGCIPADHLDEIGQLFGDDPGVGNDFDYVAMYGDIIKHLRELGY
jgi:triacylglycerol lipase